MNTKLVITYSFIVYAFNFIGSMFGYGLEFFLLQRTDVSIISIVGSVLGTFAGLVYIGPRLREDRLLYLMVIAFIIWFAPVFFNLVILGVKITGSPVVLSMLLAVLLANFISAYAADFVVRTKYSSVPSVRSKSELNLGNPQISSCNHCGVHLLQYLARRDLLLQLKQKNHWIIGRFDTNADKNTWDAVLVSEQSTKCPKCLQSLKL